MRKFPKTYEETISLEHLPISETELLEMVLRWEENGFSSLSPFLVLDWKTRKEPLGHSSISFHFQYPLDVFESIHSFLFPLRSQNQIKKKLTNILWDLFPSLKTKKILPSLTKWISSFWKQPKELRLGNIQTVKGFLEMDGVQNPLESKHLQIHGGESKLVIRIGFLKAIRYRFHEKKFKKPYPKIAECYLRTRDKHKDDTLGGVYHSLLGYSLERESDEYLLTYFGLQPLVPKSIRQLIPNEIWNQLEEFPSSDWMETNLQEEKLEFRPVYQVSTSLPHHLK